MNEAVLKAVEEHALTPEAVEQVLQLARRDDAQEHRDSLGRERKDCEKRINRLTNLIADSEGDAPSALVAKLRELENRRNAIDQELADIKPIPRLAESVLQDRLDRTEVGPVFHHARTCRTTANPSWPYHLHTLGAGYEFEAETRFDKLFIGLVAGRKVERRPGRESFIDPNDRAGMEDERFYTDEDYGRVLERAHRLLENRKANGKRPQRNRTRVLALKGPRPGPLDDGDSRRESKIITRAGKTGSE